MSHARSKATEAFTYNPAWPDQESLAVDYHTVAQHTVSDEADHTATHTYAYGQLCFNVLYAACWFGHDSLFDPGQVRGLPSAMAA